MQTLRRPLFGNTYRSNNESRCFIGWFRNQLGDFRERSSHFPSTRLFSCRFRGGRTCWAGSVQVVTSLLIYGRCQIKLLYPTEKNHQLWKQSRTEYVPVVEFMYPVFTRMPVRLTVGDSDLLLYVCYVFRALVITPLCVDCKEETDRLCFIFVLFRYAESLTTSARSETSETVYILFRRCYGDIYHLIWHLELVSIACFLYVNTLVDKWTDRETDREKSFLTPCQPPRSHQGGEEFKFNNEDGEMVEAECMEQCHRKECCLMIDI